MPNDEQAPATITAARIWQETGRAVTARGPIIPASNWYVQELHFGETPGLWWAEVEHDNGPHVEGPYESREEAEEFYA